MEDLDLENIWRHLGSILLTECRANKYTVCLFGCFADQCLPTLPNSVNRHQENVNANSVSCNSRILLPQGCALDLLSPTTLLLSWQLVIYELQLWRPPGYEQCKHVKEVEQTDLSRPLEGSQECATCLSSGAWTCCHRIWEWIFTSASVSRSIQVGELYVVWPV